MSMPIQIGLSDEQCTAISDILKKLLADTYTLYLKTHNYHWNVTGPHFSSLHKLFEEQYMEQAEAVDYIAERIRALGAFAPASYSQFAKLTSVKEDNSIPRWSQMVANLVESHEAVIRTARHGLSTIEEANDQPSLDLLTQRMFQHEKDAWMLRSLIDETHD